MPRLRLPGFEPPAETLRRDMRTFLAAAREAEADGNLVVADRLGAEAADILELSMRIEGNVG